MDKRFILRVVQRFFLLIGSFYISSAASFAGLEEKFNQEKIQNEKAALQRLISINRRKYDDQKKCLELLGRAKFLIRDNGYNYLGEVNRFRDPTTYYNQGDFIIAVPSPNKKSQLSIYKIDLIRDKKGDLEDHCLLLNFTENPGPYPAKLHGKSLELSKIYKTKEGYRSFYFKGKPNPFPNKKLYTQTLNSSYSFTNNLTSDNSNTNELADKIINGNFNEKSKLGFTKYTQKEGSIKSVSRFMPKDKNIKTIMRYGPVHLSNEEFIRTIYNSETKDDRIYGLGVQEVEENNNYSVYLIGKFKLTPPSKDGTKAHSFRLSCALIANKGKPYYYEENYNIGPRPNWTSRSAPSIETPWRETNNCYFNY